MCGGSALACVAVLLKGLLQPSANHGYPSQNSVGAKYLSQETEATLPQPTPTPRPLTDYAMARNLRFSLDMRKSKPTTKAKTPRTAAVRPDRRLLSNGQGQGMNWIWRPTREAIYLRDGDTCLYCRKHASLCERMTLDHIVPYVIGGSDRPTNLVTACADCNSRRKDMPIEDFAQMLADQGIDPKTVGPLIEAALAKPIDRKAGKARAEAITGRKF